MRTRARSCVCKTVCVSACVRLYTHGGVYACVSLYMHRMQMNVVNVVVVVHVLLLLRVVVNNILI